MQTHITPDAITAVSLPIPTKAPRFGHPGDAALFVGQDLSHDYFYYPLSMLAVVRTEDGERLYTQYEEDAHGAALYDIAEELFNITREGRVCA